MILTSQYPYGKGEPFLETEINFASRFFDNVFVIATGNCGDEKRDVPHNVTEIHAKRSFKLLRCAAHAFKGLFSSDFRKELKNVKLLRCKPGVAAMVKAAIKCLMLEKRLQLTVKGLGLHPESTIGYSYWLSDWAYFLAKHRVLFAYTVSRAHGFEIRDAVAYIPFRTIIDRGLDEISFIGEYTAGQYAAIMKPFDNEKLRAARTLNRLGVYKPQTVRRESVRRDTFRIVSCSAINAIKRLDFIVEMLAEYRGETRVEWIHFGWGPGGDKIKAECALRLNGKRNVQYMLAGWKANTEILEFYKNNEVDLFVNASDSEGIPVSIMEALSFGIPCMARTVGGIPEIVKEGLSGYLLSGSTKRGEMSAALEKIIQAKNDGSSYYLNKADVSGFFDGSYNAEVNYERFYGGLVKDKTDNKLFFVAPPNTEPCGGVPA